LHASGLIVGEKIVCDGENHIVEESAYEFLILHCFICITTFRMPEDQEEHMTKIQPELNVCSYCKQVRGDPGIQGHTLIVHP
jgi:hypothetical protein